MTPKSLVDRLENVLGLNGSPRRLRSAIEEELNAHFGLPAIQASESAEVVEAAVARVISARIAESERTGTTPIIALIGANSDVVAGYCYVLKADETHISAVKKQRLHAPSILSAMRALSFTEFEVFGARILSEMGAKYSRITPQRGDQGIDFYGQLSVGQLHDVPAPFLKLAHDVVILFAGQAKHYPNRAVGPDLIRELIGAVSLARTGTFSRPVLDIFRDLALKPFSPLVILLFTTGSVTSGAGSLAEAAGVIVRSGEQLAVFLADKGVGIIQHEQELIFDRLAFNNWLNSH
ncbi:MAG: restriction endonuclease [Terracidiphilus sp.]